MKATEGNGGPGIILAREPVEAPPIPRGSMLLPDKLHNVGEDSRVTFNRRSGAFDLTYHDCQVTGCDHGSITVFVSPFDVVTWTKRD